MSRQSRAVELSFSRSLEIPHSYRKIRLGNDNTNIDTPVGSNYS